MKTKFYRTLVACAATVAISAPGHAQQDAFVYDTTAGTETVYQGDLTAGQLTVTDILGRSFRAQRLGGAVGLGFFGVGNASLSLTLELTQFVDNTPSGSGAGDYAFFTGGNSGGPDLIITDEFGNMIVGEVDFYQVEDRTNALLPGYEGQGLFKAIAFSGPLFQGVPTETLLEAATNYTYTFEIPGVTLEDYLSSNGMSGLPVENETLELRILPGQGFDGSCCEDGKLRALAMEYTGEGCGASSHSQDPGKVSCEGDPLYNGFVFIQASDKPDFNHHKANIWFEGQVAIGDEFVLEATTAGKETLKGDTWIHVRTADGAQQLQLVRFHTSCSQPLFGGDQFGSLLVTGCIGEDEPIDGDCCDEWDDIELLTMTYTGQDCSATNHHQDPGKVSCEGDPAGEPSVIIRASDKQNPNDPKAKVWFEDIVDLGGSFDIDAANAGQGKLRTNTWVHVFDLAGTLLQQVQFHTSCSQPVVEGDQFGSLRLDGCGESQQDPPGGPDCCEGGGEVVILTMLYLGQDCSATNHHQDPGKVSCEGDPAGEPSVIIRASDKESPNDPKAKVWFEGVVDLGSAFDIDAANAGEDKLKTNTWVHVFDLSGALLQRVQFHTSCSQPVVIGDQFGSLMIEACQ